MPSQRVAVTGDPSRYSFIGHRDVLIKPGASGLLGRAVVQRFQAAGDEAVIRLAFSRADEGYTKLDLLDEEAVEAFFRDNKVDTVIHCAAERRPDVAEADPEKAARINAAVPAHLAKLSQQYSFLLIYISTDYVFNGRKPPYDVGDKPNPLQMYGRQKLAGEQEVLKAREAGAKIAVLRVPVLYGEVTYNAESAVNILQDVIEDQSGKEYKMDAYQVRFPTNVTDVGRVLVDLAHLDQPIPAILHYSSPAPSLTKYDMTQIIAAALDLPITHVNPDRNKPELKPGHTERPENTQLSTESLKEIGVDTREDAPFGEWWAAYVRRQNC